MDDILSNTTGAQPAPEMEASAGCEAAPPRKLKLAMVTERNNPVVTRTSQTFKQFYDKHLANPECKGLAKYGKDGNAFLQGALDAEKTERADDAMRTMEIAALDIDSGEPVAPILEAAERLGWEVAVYASYSDGKTETRANKKSVSRDEGLRVHLAKKLCDEFLDTCNWTGVTEDDKDYIVPHPPMPRFRVVVPLAEPVDLMERFPDLGERSAAWATFVTHVARTLGVKKFDTTCLNLSRLFYAHRRPKTVSQSWSKYQPGDGVDFDAMLTDARAWERDNPEPAANTASSASGSSSTHADAGKATKRKWTPGLVRFLKVCAPHFRAAEWAGELHGVTPKPGKNGKGLVVKVPCPFGGDHSTGEDAPDLFIGNPHDGKGFAIKCHHQTCTDAGHSAWDFLDEICSQRDPAIGVDDLVEWLTDEGKKAWQAENAWDRNKDGKRTASPKNCKLAMHQIGVSVSFNEFTGKTTIQGLADHGPRLDDTAFAALRLEIALRYQFFPTKETLETVLRVAAHENRVHPVRDYLNEAQSKWDGVARVDDWAIKYLGVADTLFNRVAARIWLIAGVRRIRKPGCKFDELPVFEGPQGGDKSSMLRTLATKDEWFTDSVTLNADAKTVVEQTIGKWMVEISELNGMRKGLTEVIKAFLSRQAEIARMSYDRFSGEHDRQFILAATTNDNKYLKDLTGNRRFWPMQVGVIDLEGLARDVDQLWGEAATLEAAGESIRLPRELWDAAAAEQAKRRAVNPYRDKLEQLFAGIEGRIPSSEVHELLGVVPGKGSQDVHNEINEAMAALGWKKPKGKIKWCGKSLQGFSKGTIATALEARRTSDSGKLVVGQCANSNPIIDGLDEEVEA